MKQRVKAKLARALVLATCLLLVWESIQMFIVIRSIDDSMTNIESMLADDGPIDDSLDSIERSLDSIERSLDSIEESRGIQGTQTPTPDPEKSGR